MLCVKCQAPIPEDAVFCPYCGRRQVPLAQAAHQRQRQHLPALRQEGEAVPGPA